MGIPLKKFFKPAALGGALALGVWGTHVLLAPEQGAQPSRPHAATETAPPPERSQALVNAPPPQSKPHDPATINAAIQAASAAVSLPSGFLTRLVNAESSGNPDARSRTSTACGLTQIIKEVMLEKAYKYGERHGFAELKEHIERVKEGRNDGIHLRYQLKNAADTAFQNICSDPDFALAMGAEHLRDSAHALQERLHRRVTSDEAYQSYVLGPDAAVPVIKAEHKKKQHNLSAVDFVSRRSIEANPPVFYKDAVHRKYPVKIAELAAWAIGKVGKEELPWIEARP